MIMMRKGVWLLGSLLIVVFVAFLFRDAIVSVILEKHTIRTCGKLLGGSCSFQSREREGSSLTLKNVQVEKNGQSATADDISVRWEYGWIAPFVTFDVKVAQLRGDAGMLPLYGVWKAVKHASARKGFRLRSWTFDDVALKTSDGYVRFPIASLEGKGGKVEATGHCTLPTKGEMHLSGSHDGSWALSLESASVPEMIHLLMCWAGPQAAILPEMQGTVSANIRYTPAGLVGNATLHALTYGAPELTLSNLQIAVQTDPHFKDWNLEGQVGSPPLHVTATLNRETQHRLSGKLSGKNISLKDILEIVGYRPETGEWMGQLDLDGEFDDKGLFASFVPGEISWKLANKTVQFNPIASTGKIWVNFSKGLERLWLNIHDGKLRYGENLEASIRGDVEVGSNALLANNLQACCGNVTFEGRLLANNLPDGNTLLIAEGGKTRLGAWEIERLQAKLSPQLNVIEGSIEGSAEAAKVQKDLKKWGIEWKESIDFPGKIKTEAYYLHPNKVDIKGKWETELLAAEANIKGDLEKDDILHLNQLDIVLLIPKIGKFARYSLADKVSFVDLNRQFIDLSGKLQTSGSFMKSLYPKNFRIVGPWNSLAFEKTED